MIYNTPFHWVVTDFYAYNFRHTLTSFVYTRHVIVSLFISLSYTDKFCSYQSLYILLFISLSYTDKFCSYQSFYILLFIPVRY